MKSEGLQIVGANMFRSELVDPYYSAYKFLQFAIPEVEVCQLFFPDNTNIKNDQLWCPEDANLISEAQKGMSGGGASSVVAAVWTGVLVFVATCSLL